MVLYLWLTRPAGRPRPRQLRQLLAGTVLGRFGQSGQAQLPHLHFQVSNASTFEEAEGLLFLLRAFERRDSATLGEVLSEPALPSTTYGPRKTGQRKLPLDGDIIGFR